MLKKFKIWIACLLSVALLVGCFPIHVIALDFEKAGNSETTDIPSGMLSQSQEYTDDTVIGEIAEIVSLRDENTKHFRLSDGTYEAVIYPQPVHRKDKNGVWQDIDNRLTLKDDGVLQKYATADSRIQFADSFKANSELFVLNENGYSISMSLLIPDMPPNLESSDTVISAVASKPTVNNSPKRSESNVFGTMDEAVKVNNKSSIVYHNVKINTSIEYVLQGNDLKENIIVKAPSNNYVYQFQMNLDGLAATLDESGNIKLYDLQSEETKYIIPAPYMYDSNGIYSEAVSYELIFVKNGVYMLEVTADETWLNSEDRAFPVTIDPSITSTALVRDSYTHVLYPDGNYGSEEGLWVSNNTTSYIYVDLPNLPEGATFNQAYLYVSYYYYVTEGSLLAGAYRVLEDWDELAITYNNAPTISTTRIGTATLTASASVTESTPGTASFWITTAVRDWYEDESTNFGIAIKREQSTTATNASVILKAYETYEDYAYISVNYTYYVPDGVYALRNVTDYTSWMTVEEDSVWAGKHVQCVSFNTSPAVESVFDRSSLFKISRVANTSRYIIRSMLNNNLSFGVSGTEIITKEIPSADSDVSDADTFYIEWDGYGFYIRPYGSENVIQMVSPYTDELGVGTKTGSSNYKRWNLVLYTGADRYGSSMFFPVDMVAGTTGTFIPIVWSTYIDYNTPKVELKSGYSDYATTIWNEDTQEATVNFHDNGEFKLILLTCNENQISCSSGEYAFTITLVIEEGVYFIRNKEVGKYMQVDDADKPGYNTSESIMELWGYNGRDYQKWQLIHDKDGYYKILSVKSGLALCVKSDSTNKDEIALVQESYSDVSRKKWKITESSSGAYILRPKSGESYTTDWCMCAGDQFLWVTDDLNVEQRAYVNNGSYKDEWHLDFDITSTSIRMPNENAQNKTMWCWAACSKMVGEHNGGDGALSVTPALLTIKAGVHSWGGELFYGETSTGDLTADGGQREIVIDVHGDDDNHPGSNDDKEKALQLASIKDMDVGTWGTRSLSTANITAMNNELAAGRWVIGNIFTNNGRSGHSIVIRSYDTTKQIYTFWEPWTDSDGTFTRTQLLNNTIHTASNMADYTLACVQYCN